MPHGPVSRCVPTSSMRRSSWSATAATNDSIVNGCGIGRSCTRPAMRCLLALLIISGVLVSAPRWSLDTNRVPATRRPVAWPGRYGGGGYRHPQSTGRRFSFAATGPSLSFLSSLSTGSGHACGVLEKRGVPAQGGDPLAQHAALAERLRKLFDLIRDENGKPY